MNKLISTLSIAAFISVAITACSGGGGSTSTGATSTITSTTYTIGGTISGLTSGSLVLKNNGSDALTIGANSSSFTFAAPLTDISSYAVTVDTQPSGLTCSVTSGSGTLAGANITNVVVTCSATTYTIGGTVSGLATGSLVLKNNGGDALTINANSSTFTFATALADNAPYAVTIDTQPSGLTCSVTCGVGALARANVTNIALVCSTNWAGTKQMGVAGQPTYGYSVATDASGNVFVAGNTTGGLDGNTLTGTQDFFVTKYNASGVRQ